MRKLWGIRHVRFLWNRWLVFRHARAWGRMGIGLGYPNQTDLDVLDMIWRGER
ncbi:hypothetical protein [Sphingobium lignivorans]|uniref:Transposase n=1 Tax=Sphingobium lignivorans TaxID=2735886 RepID=A0ABR6NLM3_9SPHN|nr:hypothetical protein [Sphingobium lignivorans]MBB5987428.1 hypothetical protein [Sphingobium lignivorans]